MSRVNVEEIRKGYDAMNALMRGELTAEAMDSWLGFYHADVETHDLPNMPDAPVRRGHDDLRKWIETMRDVWAEGSYLEPERFTFAGDFVIVAVRAHGRGRGSGAPIDASFFQVLEVREEKVQRIWTYWDEAEALKAAGLSE